MVGVGEGSLVARAMDVAVRGSGRVRGPGSRRGAETAVAGSRRAGGPATSASQIPDYFQVSLLVRVPEAGVVKVRLPPDSQVTVPSGFFLRYLYSTAVFGGRFSVARQTG